MNYYDDKKLEQIIKPFVIDCLSRQMKFNLKKDIVFCFGEGKNYNYLLSLNKEIKMFERVIPLPHPRFIMQYRLKKKDEYINKYLQLLA